MIEAAAFVAYATVVVWIARWWDRRSIARSRQHAHRSIGSRFESWLIGIGFLADEAESAEYDAADKELRRRGR